MTLRGVGTRRFARVHPVGDVPPVIGIDMDRIEILDLVAVMPPEPFASFMAERVRTAVQNWSRVAAG